jgi:hypothetical protein
LLIQGYNKRYISLPRAKKSMLKATKCSAKTL